MTFRAAEFLNGFGDSGRNRSPASGSGRVHSGRVTEPVCYAAIETPLRVAVFNANAAGAFTVAPALEDVTDFEAQEPAVALAPHAPPPAAGSGSGGTCRICVDAS